MTTTEFVCKNWATFTDEEIINLINDAINQGYIYPEDEQIFLMEDFDENMEDVRPSEIARLIMRSGHFNPRDDYYRVDDYDGIETIGRGEVARKTAHLAYSVGVYLMISGLNVGDYVSVTDKNRPWYDIMWRDYLSIADEEEG